MQLGDETMPLSALWDNPGVPATSASTLKPGPSPRPPSPMSRSTVNDMLLQHFAESITHTLTASPRDFLIDDAYADCPPPGAADLASASTSSGSNHPNGIPQLLGDPNSHMVNMTSPLSTTELYSPGATSALSPFVSAATPTTPALEASCSPSSSSTSWTSGGFGLAPPASLTQSEANTMALARRLAWQQQQRTLHQQQLRQRQEQHDQRYKHMKMQHLRVMQPQHGHQTETISFVSSTAVPQHGATLASAAAAQHTLSRAYEAKNTHHKYNTRLKNDKVKDISHTATASSYAWGTAPALPEANMDDVDWPFYQRPQFTSDEEDDDDEDHKQRTGFGRQLDDAAHPAAARPSGKRGRGVNPDDPGFVTLPTSSSTKKSAKTPKKKKGAGRARRKKTTSRKSSQGSDDSDDDSIYPCPASSCKETFRSRFSLKRHMKRHMGLRPHVCPYKGCKARFAENSTLTRHIRTHTGERPYACSYPGCNKTFADRTNVKRHVLVHTGVKPFPCRVGDCTRRFTRKSYLRRHMKTQHNEDLD